MRTVEHLEAAVEHLLSLQPTPVAVLVSGDLVDQGTREEYELLASLLAPLKERIPVYIAPGNHDDRDRMREIMRAHGYDYLPEEGPLQYTVDIGELRLISLDTVVPGEAGGLLCEKRLGWLGDRLAEDSRPTLVMQHHPPFMTGLARMDSMGLAEASNEEAIIRKHPHVLRILSGHLHRTIHAGFGGTVAHVAPSCAHAVELDLRTTGRLAVVGEPPAASVHVWRDGTLVTHTSFIQECGPAYVIAE